MRVNASSERKMFRPALRAHLGTSMTTFVDLTTASASLPGSSPRSSTASEVSKRNHSMWTGLNLDLGNYFSLLHRGYDSYETVAGRPTE